MTYQELKERARQAAIDWQHDSIEFEYSYEGLITLQNYFYKIGKRYGLLKEFRENGIPC